MKHLNSGYIIFIILTFSANVALAERATPSTLLISKKIGQMMGGALILDEYERICLDNKITTNTQKIYTYSLRVLKENVQTKKMTANEATAFLDHQRSKALDEVKRIMAYTKNTYGCQSQKMTEVTVYASNEIETSKDSIRNELMQSAGR